jgi:arabinofuranosyltransferase
MTLSELIPENSPLGRYLGSFVEGWPWLVGALVVFAGFVLVLRFGLPQKHANKIALAVGAAISLFGLFYAWHLRWLCDDAFISFRYAENWVRGHGLVFNPGERVEGYTNFLWTLLMAVGIAAGLNPGQLSIVLTLASLVGAFAVCVLLARRLLAPGAPLPGLVAAAALAVSYTFASFGTSGLETVPAAVLVLWAAERAEKGAFLFSGLLGILATLAHPDHSLLYAALGASVALVPGTLRERALRLVRYGAPFVGLFVPYYLARWAYYGDFFPNTYYAKNAHLFYFSQGLNYVAVCGLIAGLPGILPFALHGAIAYRRTVFGRFFLLGVPLYALYVLKIGGDFMLGRLLCAVLPLIFLSAELSLRVLVERRLTWVAAVASVLMAPVALPNGLIEPYEKYRHIADERTFYALRSFSPLEVELRYTNEARELKRAFARAPRKPTIGVGCIGIVGYLSGFPIMDNWGLANRAVAHMQVTKRARPGHEKLATPGHALEHGVDFSDIELWPSEYGDLTRAKFGEFHYWVGRLDPEVMQPASRVRGVSVPDIRALVYRYTTLGKPAERVACDHWFFEEFYFAHQIDPDLREKLVRAFTAHEPRLGEVEPLLLGAPGTEDGRFQRRGLFAFDDYGAFTREGNAFGTAPAEAEMPNQARAFGHVGPFANSYHPTQGDAARGRLLSKPFVLQGEAITLLVAGGFKQGTAEVRLLVDGHAVRTATGCTTEVFGRRVWPTHELRGREARIEIVDASKEGWGHVLVDEIVEWRRVR